MADDNTGKQLAAHVAECGMRWSEAEKHREETEAMLKTLSPKTVGYWAKALATALPFIGVLALGIGWAADQRYVTSAELGDGFRAMRVLQLDDEIFKLQQIEDLYISQNERARLARYIRERERLMNEKNASE